LVDQATGELKVRLIPPQFSSTNAKEVIQGVNYAGVGCVLQQVGAALKAEEEKLNKKSAKTTSNSTRSVTGGESANKRVDGNEKTAETGTGGGAGTGTEVDGGKSVNGNIDGNGLPIPPPPRDRRTMLAAARERTSLNLSAVANFPAVRCVALLPPMHTKLAVDPVRQMRTSIDNTIYLFPSIFERFQHRNLSVKIQLVEYIEPIIGRIPHPEAAFHVLRNVYNAMPGPAFCTAGFTTVSYHSRTPILGDEIKIRLPDLITDRHWLKLTVQHVYVKQKTINRNSFLDVLWTTGSMSDSSGITIGTGYLPLMTDGKALLPDIEHSVPIFDSNATLQLFPGSGLGGTQSGNNSVHGQPSGSSHSASSSASSSTATVSAPAPAPQRRPTTSPAQISLDTSTLPAVRIKTRSFASMASSCKRVQAALTIHPPPLGRLPTCVIPVEMMDILTAQDQPNGTVSIEDAINEEKLALVTADLADAVPLEVVRHFLVLMRQLLRTLCGGTCKYSASRANPYAHPASRCRAFLTMLQLFGKVCPEVNGVSGDRERERSVRIANPPSTGAKKAAAVPALKTTDLEIGSGGEDLLNAYMEFLFDEEVPVSKFLSSRRTSRTGSFDASGVMDTAIFEMTQASQLGVMPPAPPPPSMVAGKRPAFRGMDTALEALAEQDENVAVDSSGESVTDKSESENAGASPYKPESNTAAALESASDESNSSHHTGAPSAVEVVNTNTTTTPLTHPSGYDSSDSDDDDAHATESAAVATAEKAPTIPGSPTPASPHTPHNTPHNNTSMTATVWSGDEGAAVSPAAQYDTTYLSTIESIEDTYSEGADPSDGAASRLTLISGDSAVMSLSERFDEPLEVDTESDAAAAGAVGAAGAAADDTSASPLETPTEDTSNVQPGLMVTTGLSAVTGLPMWDDEILLEEASLLMALQVERAVLEVLLREGVAVTVKKYTVSPATDAHRLKAQDKPPKGPSDKEGNGNGEAEDGDDFVIDSTLLSRRGLRWWTKELYGPEYSIGSQHTISSFSTSSSAVGGKCKKGETIYPFDCERQWFKNLERGLPDDYNDIQVEDGISGPGSASIAAPVEAVLDSATPTPAVALATVSFGATTTTSATASATVSATASAATTPRPQTATAVTVSPTSPGVPATMAVEATAVTATPLRDATSQGIPQATPEGEPVRRRRDSVRTQDSFNSLFFDVSVIDGTAKSSTISLIPPRSRYDELDGHIVRSTRFSAIIEAENQATAAAAAAAASSTGAYESSPLALQHNRRRAALTGPDAEEQWWPWLYEVLVSQWCAVLCTIQGSAATSSAAGSERRNTSKSSSGDYNNMRSSVVAAATSNIYGTSAGPTTPTATYSNPSAATTASNSKVAILSATASSAAVTINNGGNNTSRVNWGASTQPVSPYPFELSNDIPRSNNCPYKDTRMLLADHGPLLLLMIMKSLVMRIKREEKRTPVILDPQFATALESLVVTIAIEVATATSNGVVRNRKLNSALATFLRRLFAVASPSQVSTLIAAYFSAMRGRGRVVETELRLQFLEELSMFDHSVAVNFPLTVDAPLSLFTFNLTQEYFARPSSLKKILDALADSSTAANLRANTFDEDGRSECALIAYSARGLRGLAANPSPHWLAYIFVAEAMAAYRQEERKVKTLAVAILRDLLVRHS
jgi:hypothetical protein